MQSSQRDHSHDLNNVASRSCSWRRPKVAASHAKVQVYIGAVFQKALRFLEVSVYLGTSKHLGSGNPVCWHFAL
jgi:hypothetical protein